MGSWPPDNHRLFRKIALTSLRIFLLALKFIGIYLNKVHCNLFASKFSYIIQIEALPHWYFTISLDVYYLMQLVHHNKLINFPSCNILNPI